MSVAILAPVFYAEVDSPLSDTCYATDATLTHGSAVQAAVTPEEAVALWSRASRRGRRTLLFPATPVHAVAGVLAEDEAPAMEDVLITEWVRRKQFRLITNWKFRRPAHINLQELAAAGMVIRRLGKSPKHWSCRVPLLLDSSVVRGMLTRGRSSSRRANYVLRRLVPFQLVTGVRLHCRGSLLHGR